MREVQAERRPKVLPLLTEAICQSSQAADLHAHGEILALHNRSADAARIAVADKWSHLVRRDAAGEVDAMDLERRRAVERISRARVARP